MQDKTINNALLALRKQGGEQAELALQLLALRQISLPRHFQIKPAKRRSRARFVLDQLSGGPKTAPDIADMLQLEFGFPRRSALNRVYCCLVRLEGKGLVRKGVGPDGCLWRAKNGNSAVG